MILPIISHLFTDHDLVNEMESLEGVLYDLRGKSQDYSYQALVSAFPEKRVRAIKRLMRSDVYQNSIHFRGYLKQKLFPAALKCGVEDEAQIDDISYVLRMDFYCDKCDPATLRREIPAKDYVFEEDIRHIFRANRVSSDRLYCEAHRRQRDISISTAMHMYEARGVRQTEDGPEPYSLHCIKAGVKSGESLNFKVADRLMSWEPIWDFYRARVVMRNPISTEEITDEENYIDLLATAANILKMRNPDRKRFNSLVKNRFVKHGMDRESRKGLMAFLEEHYFVPYTDHRLITAEGDIVPLSNKPEYREEQIFDHHVIPIEIKLTSLAFETAHSQGELAHAEYEKRKAFLALHAWDDSQKGAFQFFDETRFFDRTPRLI